MSDHITFKYGTYNFRPWPLFSVNSRPLKTEDGTGYGVVHTINVEGTILTPSGADQVSGINYLFSQVESLKTQLNQDGRLFVVACNNSPILSGYPKINGYTINNQTDNYTRRANYTIELEMPGLTGNDDYNGPSGFPPYIESATESWDVEFADDRTQFDWTLPGGTAEKFGYKVAVTHTVDVKARLNYTGVTTANTPWDDARRYASGLLGFDNDLVTLSGILGLPHTISGYFTSYDVFNNFRRVSTNKTDGSINVVETFVVSPSGADSLPNNAIETFDISVNQQDGMYLVNVNGNIEGLAKTQYTPSGMYVVSSKFAAASGYYKTVASRMYERAKAAYNAVVTGTCARSLNPILSSRTVGINPIEGTISYDYVYDTTVEGCITGTCIISKSISINDTLESDVFAPQTVPGRALGPILQDIGTRTAKVRNISVELVVVPPSSCDTITEIYKPVPTGAIQNFVDMVSGDLVSNYGSVFTSDNSQSWNFTQGRYSKNISFTYGDC